MNIKTKKHMTSSLSIAALALISVAATQAATMSIDFNDNDDGPKLTQTGFTAATTGNTTVSTDLGVGESMTVGILLTDNDDRDRGAVTSGPGLAQSDLLRDFVFRGGSGLVLQLSTLKAGTYSFTGFFHDTTNQQKAGRLTVDRDGWSTGALDEEEVVSSFIYSTGTAPTTVGTASFTFEADGINPVAIVVRSSDGGTAHVINGFTVTAVPEPSSTALLGLGGFALILRRRK